MIYNIPGRSKDNNENIIREIAALLGDRLEIQPTDIFVIINEPILDNWGFRGEQANKLMD